MYDPAQLSALSAVIRLGAFDAAAHALGVTPSAISQRVKALEDSIGTTLIQRGIPCTATPTGARLARHYDDLTLLETALAADIGQKAAPARLRVAVADEAALLPEAVDAISKKQAYKAIKVFLALHQDESLPLIEREHALFQVGLIYMSKANVHRDDEHAIYYFRKLLTQHPDSLYCVDAQARIDEIYTRQNQG